MVVVVDVVLVVVEVLVVVVVPGFFSVGTQSSRRWISSGFAGPNWLLVNVCTIPNPKLPSVSAKQVPESPGAPHAPGAQT